MSDNTTVQGGGGGDVIRDIDRSASVPAGTAKTQVVALDVGGPANESLVSPANPVPVTLGGCERVSSWMQMQQLQWAAAQPANGFVPLEIPTFLAGV